MKPGTTEYTKFHKFVRDTLGYANEYCCEDCGEQADQWSHMHETSHDDIKNYHPRCYSCHGKYDCTENKRELARQRMIGNDYTLGRVRPEEERAKLRGNTNASGVRSEEARKRMSQAKIGKRGNNSKFTEDQEREIYEMWLEGSLQRDIAKCFGVSHSCIKRICSRVKSKT
jgi:hypothetical protein